MALQNCVPRRQYWNIIINKYAYLEVHYLLRSLYYLKNIQVHVFNILFLLTIWQFNRKISNFTAYLQFAVNLISTPKLAIGFQTSNFLTSFVANLEGSHPRFDLSYVQKKYWMKYFFYRSRTNGKPKWITAVRGVKFRYIYSLLVRNENL